MDLSQRESRSSSIGKHGFMPADGKGAVVELFRIISQCGGAQKISVLWEVIRRGKARARNGNRYGNDTWGGGVVSGKLIYFPLRAV